MRALRSATIAAAIVLAAGAATAATADRYVAPRGVFSIAANDPAAPLFRPGKENASGDIVVVDFPFLDSAGLAEAWGRTVEWLKLGKPVDPTQYDGEATAMVDGYLEARYGAGKFTVAGSGKFRTSDGRLVYVFAAKGDLQETPARWQGTVQFFDTGVALVGEAVAQPSNDRSDAASGIVSQPAVDWAQTLKPGG